MGINSSQNLKFLNRGLIVSCQAHYDHPLREPATIAALALCAERGGAVGIRADGPEDVKKVKETVSIPIVGIYKEPIYKDRFFITPTFEHAQRLSEAGAGLIALEATRENQPENEKLGQLIREIREDLEIPVIADVSTFEEGIRAWEMGADLIATTLSGYTRDTQHRSSPDLSLVSELVDAGINVVCEGHIRTPDQVGEAMERGAHAVVVGTAITDALAITSWFAEPTRSIDEKEVPSQEGRQR